MKTSIGGGADEGRLPAAHLLQHAGYVFGRHLAMPLRVGLKLFEDRGGTGHRPVFAANMNPVVVGRDAHPQRIADLPHMLIAGAKQGDQDLGTDNRNGGFTHPVRAGILAVALTKEEIGNTTSIPNSQPLRLAAGFMSVAIEVPSPSGRGLG